MDKMFTFRSGLVIALMNIDVIDKNKCKVYLKSGFSFTMGDNIEMSELLDSWRESLEPEKFYQIKEIT